MQSQPDITELQTFYRTPLGQWVQRLLAREIERRWADEHGGVAVGYGYPLPFMPHLQAGSDLSCVVMPARQGVVCWPSPDDADRAPLRTRARSFLTEEAIMPFPDASLDRVLVMHALEVADRPEEVLTELWRCLRPEGKLMLVVPNRRGVWARIDSTPFGHGRPYSRGQLERLLQTCRFSMESVGHSLFMPPFNMRWLVKSAPVWERAGYFVSPAFSGLLMVEAHKELYAPIHPGHAVRVRATARPAPVGAATAKRLH